MFYLGLPPPPPLFLLGIHLLNYTWVQSKKEAKNVPQLGDFSVDQEGTDNMDGH